MPATRTNRYDGSCNSCGGRVPAGLGTCERSGSHWLIRHQPADSSAPGQVINRPAPAADPAEGMYLVGDDVFKVVISRQSGRPYAKRLILDADGGNGRWEYDGRRHFAQLTPENAMTFEQACAFGHAHGICARCGCLLDDVQSVAAGIGPVCARHWGVRRPTRGQVLAEAERVVTTQLLDAILDSGDIVAVDTTAPAATYVANDKVGDDDLFEEES
jgi:hypothetical protein